MSDTNPIDTLTRPAMGVLGILAIALAAVTFFSSWQSRQELLSMPRERRHEVYEHVLRTVTGVCARNNGQGVTDYCRDQAEYITLFPDCDASCHEVSRRFFPRPTR